MLILEALLLITNSLVYFLFHFVVLYEDLTFPIPFDFSKPLAYYGYNISFISLQR